MNEYHRRRLEAERLVARLVSCADCHYGLIAMTISDMIERAEPGIRAPGPALTTTTSVGGWHVMAAPYPSVPGVTFKDVEGHPGYCVGDDGSAWSSRKRVAFSTWASVPGYWRRLAVIPAGHRAQSRAVVMQDADGKRRKKLLGSLVLTAFVGPCPDGMECCHNDGNPDNNRLENLRWDTHLGNMADRERHGTNYHGERKHGSKLTDDDIRRIFALKLDGLTNDEIGARLSVNGATVSRILTRQNWAHLSLAPLPSNYGRVCPECGEAKARNGRCYRCRPAPGRVAS